MSEREDREELAELEQVNAELSDSLDRCRALLQECRSKLVANSNEEEVEDESRHG